MERHEDLKKSRLVKIDSLKTWNLYKIQAANKGCPVVIHFTAAWCVPSVMMKPLMEELALTYQETLFLSLDVDEVKEVALEMKIKAMPTFVLMKEGSVVDKFVGANQVEIKKRISAFVQTIPLSY